MLHYTSGAADGCGDGVPAIAIRAETLPCARKGLELGLRRKRAAVREQELGCRLRSG
jgi:hypothetical protein